MRGKILLLALSAVLLTLESCARPRDKRSAPSAWMELPAVPASQSANLYALEMEVDGRKQRNYTFLWNEERMTADWVAYPLCKGNMGKGKRTNAFGLCPLLKESRQPLLVKGYREGNDGYYSRGHQVPSADRLERNANVQTFYGVNMTPQDENLNGGVWSALENKVRSWAQRCDTLYVVSGCTYDGYEGAYALDNSGKKVAVPTGYYKALLMLRNGNWYAYSISFENRPYNDGKYHPELSRSLSDLEARTGLVFFPLLKGEVGEKEYQRIKSEDPKQISVWR